MATDGPLLGNHVQHGLDHRPLLSDDDDPDLAHIEKTICGIPLPEPVRHFLKDYRPIVRAFLFLVIYIFGGAGIYKYCEDWSYANGIYFMVVTGTTVGYGDMTPSNWYSKLVTCFIIILGISSLAFAMSIIASFLLARQEEMMKKMKSQSAQELKNMSSRTPKIPEKLLQALAITFVSLSTGTIIYATAENGSFIDSLYWAVVTSSTVGYGDQPLDESVRHWACIYILCATALTAAAMGKFVDFLLERQNQERVDAILNQKLTVKGISNMDADGDGQVSPQEFLEAMLVNLSLVDKSEIDRINARFKQLDADGSGFLDEEDLRILLESGKPLG